MNRFVSPVLIVAMLAGAAAAREALATTQATSLPATNAVTDFPPITLQAAAIAPEEAFARLAKETGAELVTDHDNLFQGENRPGAVFIDVQRQPFWLAMDALCRATGVGVRGLRGGDERIVLLPRGDEGPLWGKRPHVVSGPALFIPEAITRTDRRDFFRTKSAEPVALVSVDVWLDPRLRALTITGPARVTEAVDETGLVLPRDPSDVDSAGGANGAQWSHRMRVRLLLPPNAGKRIATLRGEVTFLTAVKAETWELGKLTDPKGKSKVVLGYTVKVENVTIGTGGGGVRIGTVRTDETDKGPMGWGQFLPFFHELGQQIQLLDENGTPMRVTGWGGSSSDKFVTQDINFAADNNDKAKPTKMVWVVPTETREVTVPFELKDLMLP